MRFFKSKKPTLEQTSETLDKTVEGIDKNIDKYNKELNVIKKKIEEEKKKKPVNNQVINALRKKAEILIKRKRMYETNKENTLGIQFNIDQVKFTNDSIKTQIDTCKVLEASSKELKKNIKKVNINKIEKLQEDIFDYMEESKEITEILGTSYEVPVHLDENEIDTELALIEDSLLDDELVTEEGNVADVLEENEKEASNQEVVETNVDNKENNLLFSQSAVKDNIREFNMENKEKKETKNENIDKETISGLHMKIR